MEDDKQYKVGENLRKRIKAAVAHIPKKSQQLHNKIATTESIDITSLKVALTVDSAAAAADDIVEVHTLFDDDVEEERE